MPPRQTIKLSQPRALNHEERRILEKLLSVNFPGRDILRKQIDFIGVSEECKDCFSIGFILDKALVEEAGTERRVPIEAEGYEPDGMKIHVLLFINNGYIDELQIYREDLGSINHLPLAESIQVLNFFDV